MSGHRYIPYNPAGQPRATGYGCTGLLRLLYANRAKVNVYVSTTHATSRGASTCMGAHTEDRNEASVFAESRTSSTGRAAASCAVKSLHVLLHMSHAHLRGGGDSVAEPRRALLAPCAACTAASLGDRLLGGGIVAALRLAFGGMCLVCLDESHRYPVVATGARQRVVRRSRNNQTRIPLWHTTYHTTPK